jgi:hypothetical protein
MCKQMDAAPASEAPALIMSSLMCGTSIMIV